VAGAARKSGAAHLSAIGFLMIVIFFNNPGPKCGYFLVQVKLISFGNSACNSIIL